MPPERARRVAVIGAGSSGLTCIKTCVDEGLEPVCFESSHDIGGLWNYKEQPESERSSIYGSLVSNTSKEMMCFSDFPMPEDYPNFLHHSQLLKYFRLYAEHFNLLRYIHFQTTVRRVAQRPDFSVSGQWDVVTVKTNGAEEKHIFDAVLVCSGQYTHPVLPLTDFKGHEEFRGRLLHGWEFKDGGACRGKRVVVVGIGNSGGDIAVEISRTAGKTFLSTRKGAWVVGRVGRGGLPLDMVLLTRFNSFLLHLLPRALVNGVAERALNGRYDHRLYALKPPHRFLERRIVINDDLPGRLLQGALTLKPNIREFSGSGVVFEDGTVEDNIDLVVFCTGYDRTFSFLPSSLSEGPHGEVSLYKRMFPPSLPHPTLAVLGFFQTRGPIMPAVELQARWAVKVFTGLNHLPSEEKMLEVIERERRQHMHSYSCPRLAALQLDYIPYVSFLATEIGAKPNFLRLFLTDPVLWVTIVFGPCTPYQYRLTGPGRWEGARRAILTQWERVAQPLRTRAILKPKGRRSVLCWPWLMTLGGATIVATIWWQNQTNNPTCS